MKKKTEKLNIWQMYCNATMTLYNEFGASKFFLYFYMSVILTLAICNILPLKIFPLIAQFAVAILLWLNIFFWTPKFFYKKKGIKRR